MKIFHLSDLHIGLKLMNRDLREDQEYIFRQIVDRTHWSLPEIFMIRQFRPRRRYRYLILLWDS